MKATCTNSPAFLLQWKELIFSCLKDIEWQVNTNHIYFLVGIHAYFWQECYRHVFTALLESLSQHGNHVFMVIQKLPDQFTEPSLHILILNLQSEVQQQH